MGQCMQNAGHGAHHGESMGSDFKWKHLHLARSLLGDPNSV